VGQSTAVSFNQRSPNSAIPSYRL